MRTTARHSALVALATVVLAGPSAARAAVCTAAEVLTAAGCDDANPTSTCTIAGTFDVGPDCDLNFQNHPVVLTGTLRSQSSGGSFAIEAASLTLAGGSLRVAGTTAGDDGGTLTVEVATLFRMQGGAALVDADGDDSDGGSVFVTAGSIDVLAGSLHANGVGAGSLDDGSRGGRITLVSAGTLGIAGTIEANGSGGPDGGSGDGIVSLSAGGAVTIGATLEATGAGPDGSGGTLTIESTGGGIDVNAVLTAEGKGGQSSGGTVQLAAATHIEVGANIVASGANDAAGVGEITLQVAGAPGAITIAAGKSLRVRNGGEVTTSSPGPLMVLGTIDASGSGIADGGKLLLGPHCGIQIDGTLDARPGPDGADAEITLQGRTVTIARTGVLRATPCHSVAPASCNTLVVETGVPTIVGGATVSPMAQELVDPAMNACCGNGVLEGVEQCDDGNQLYCDGSCGGNCTIQPPDPCPGDGNPCIGACVPQSGLCEPLTGTPCPPDGDPCTSDVCNAGTCTHPDGCAALSGPCVVGTCQPGVGCTTQNLPDGSGCRGSDVCKAYACSAGACLETGPLDCDDGDPCTSDSCHTTVRGCRNLEIPGACTCVGKPPGSPCADGNSCTRPDTCDASGQCIGGPRCDDGNPCTRATCSPNLLGCGFEETEITCLPLPCTGKPDGAPCSDFQSCTVGTCQAGSCSSTPLVCADPDETCREGFGCRFTPASPCPDDGDPCTAERIDPVLGCVHDPLTGPPCADDGDQCTQDVCASGTCTHPPRICDDGLACTANSCNAGTGCVFTPHDALCDDGDTCTVDRCMVGTGCTHTGSCPLDHFACYKAKKAPGTPVFARVTGVDLEDRFATSTVDVIKLLTLCAPTNKNGEDPSAPAHPDHLGDYKTVRRAGAAPVPQTGLQVSNQLGMLVVDAVKPAGLLVPTTKSLSGMPAPPVPPDPDHFQCYKVRISSGTPRFAPVLNLPVEDQFEAIAVDVKKPRRLCVPANKSGEDPGAPAHPGHLLCYQVKAVAGSPKFPGVTPVFVQNQFGPHTLSVSKLRELCVPSQVMVP